MLSYNKQDILIACTEDKDRRILVRNLKSALIKRKGEQSSRVKFAGNDDQILALEDKDAPVFKTVEDFLKYLQGWKPGQQTIDIAIFDNDLSNLGGKLWGIDAMILMCKTVEELQIELKSVLQNDGSTIFSAEDLARMEAQGINYATVLINLTGIKQQREADTLPPIKIIAFTDLKGAPREKAVILGQLTQSQKLLDSEKFAGNVVTLILKDPNYVSAKKNPKKRKPTTINTQITPVITKRRVKAKNTKQATEHKGQQSESARVELQALIPPPLLRRTNSDGGDRVTSEGWTEENKVDIRVWIPSGTTSPSSISESLGSLLGSFSITTTTTFSSNKKTETEPPKKEALFTNNEQGGEQQDTNKNTR